jgi:hypothetical protein
LVNLRVRNVAYSMLFVTPPWTGAGYFRGRLTAGGRKLKYAKSSSRAAGLPRQQGMRSARGVREAAAVTLRDVRHGLFSSKRGMRVRYLLLTGLS